MKQLVLFLFIPFLTYAQVQIGQDIIGEGGSDNSGDVVSISSDGSILAISAVRNDGNGENSGHVRIYRNLGSNWMRIGQDIDGEAEGDLSGRAVSMSSDGTIVAITSIDNDDNGENSGHVRIYRNINGWVQIGQDIDGEAEGDQSGRAVSLSSNGSVVAIGAARNDGNGENSGHVRIYENNSDNWVQIGQDIDGVEGDQSGTGVSLSSDGSIVAIGAPVNSENGTGSGTVRVYRNENGSWVQMGQDINGETIFNNSGDHLSLSSDGSIVAIASPSNDDNGAGSGQVRIYEYTGDTWIQVGQDIEGDEMFDGLGNSVSLSSNGTVVAIGIPGRGGSSPTNDSGRVRIYQNEGGTWIQKGVDIEGETLRDFLGISVSLSSNGTIVAVGAPASSSSSNPSGSGYVRVYDLSDVVLSTQESTVTDFSVYPNPAQSIITISLSDSDLLKQINVYNTLGQKVIGSTQESFDISSLSSGVYMLEVITSQGKGIQKLLVE